MEALAILLVMAVAAIIFVVTWFGVANSPRNATAELDQLEEYREEPLYCTARSKSLKAFTPPPTTGLLSQVSTTRRCLPLGLGFGTE